MSIEGLVNVVLFICLQISQVMIMVSRFKYRTKSVGQLVLCFLSFCNKDVLLTTQHDDFVVGEVTLMAVQVNIHIT